MCGIVACLATGSVAQNLAAGLARLQNRGYDSVGLCTFDTREFVLHRFVSTTESNALLAVPSILKHHQHSLGIAHSRWATHGAKTIQNAHPHVVNNVALVHNGVIANYKELQAELKYTPKTETDSEIIAAVISDSLRKYTCFDEALIAAFNRLKGSWAVVFMLKNRPGCLFLAKHGQPLVVTQSATGLTVASEISGLVDVGLHYSMVEDGEIIELQLHQQRIITPALSTGLSTALSTAAATLAFFTPERQRVFPSVKVLDNPAPFTHWTMREIMEQKEVISRIIETRVINQEVQFPELTEITQLKTCQHLVFLGCGTSHHSGLIATQYLQWLGLVETVHAIDASEFTPSQLPLSAQTDPDSTVVICVSQSGETKDVHRALEQVKGTTLSLVNVQDSWIARTCTASIYLDAGREVGVASTKAFTAQVIMLSLFALYIAKLRGASSVKIKRMLCDLIQFQEKLALVCTDRPIYTKIAQDLVKHKACFLLGRGIGYTIALESALKMKEIGYIHAQGFGAGSLKHGPFALIEPGTIILLIAPTDVEERIHQFEATAEEVSSRHADIIWITDKPIRTGLAGSRDIVVPFAGLFTPLLANIQCQLIAFYLSLAKDINPDFPRNLAKVVTVDG